MGKRSKTKRAKHNQRINPRKPQKKQGLLSKLYSLLSPTGWLCALIVFFLTIVTAYYTFAFKLSITPSKPLDPTNPFSTPFVLRNDSLLWINLVNPNMYIENEIRTDKYITFKGLGIHLLKPLIPKLESRESTSFIISFDTVFKNAGKINYADIEIIISYYPAFSPSLKIFQREFRTRFVAYYSKNGTVQWEHKAKSE